MKQKKKYYNNIDLIRLLACFSILLYHLNILKGGYLAVCVFFVLSGYLSCISAFRKEKFSLLSYYSNRLLKIYLPLLLVVFITISAVSLFPNISWLNLKPETTSVIFGYNNFWQLSANLDYFSRHIDSPFMHLWYISILMQFDLVFPFIYLILRKVGDKINKIIPCITTILLSIIFSIYFYKISLTQNIMITYYNTFTRIFSLFFGLALGFIHSYYGSLIPKSLKSNPYNKIVFYSYLLVLICLFIFADAKSIFFQISMILVTLITCRLIDYGTISIKKDLSIFDKSIKSLAIISYEIYLFQYPVIFLFQYININNYFKIPIIIIIILLLSYIFHFCIDFNNKKKFKIFRYVIFIIVLCIFLHGVYQYYLSKDHTKEMKRLEEQLVRNEQMMQEKQEEYALKIKLEDDEWMSILKDLENGENELKSIVSNLSVVGIGDSVMLGAVENLYKEFPNGYFDAKISRTAWKVNGILQDLKNENMLGDTIVLNLGANGDCSESCKMEIMKTCENREVFWINVTNDNDVHINEKLFSLASKYDNLHIIDWNSISSGHPEYFFSDGIHLTEVGKEVYTKSIYDNIYQVYLEKYKDKKEQIIKEHEEESKNKISFYGNDILLNAFDYIESDFTNSRFIINKEFNYGKLRNEIQKSIEDNSLTYRIVFAFDNVINLSSEEYANLIDLCNGHEVYILSTSEQFINNLYNLNYENVTIINFYQEIESNSDYLMIDGIHLTQKGNQALSEILNDVLN